MKSQTQLFIAAALAGASVLVVAPHPSFAHSGTADEQAACTPDVFRLCFWEIPSEERIVACLNKKVAQLSPACHDVIAGPDPKDKRSEKR